MSLSLPRMIPGSPLKSTVSRFAQASSGYGATCLRWCLDSGAANLVKSDTLWYVSDHRPAHTEIEPPYMTTNLNFSPSNLDRVATADYWKALNPGMSITDYPFQTPIDSRVRVTTAEVTRCVQQIREEGHFRLAAALPRDRMTRMAQAMENIVAAGYPPAFAYVYDDFWLVFRDLAPLLIPLYGEGYRIVTNLWAWHISPSDTDHGFKPHRDMVGKNTLRSDGSPIYGTVWIPLTDVTTQHACIYVLPTNRDPNVPSKLENFSVPQESVQAIRALPAEAGSVLGWNTYALHWGSRSSRWANGPRISIATYIKRAEERTLNSVSVQPNQFVSLEARLAVIGLNMVHYDADSITEARYPAKLMKFCDQYTRKFSQPATAQHQAVPTKPVVEKVGRNVPCPCGSGKKYKHCHGQT